MEGLAALKVIFQIHLKTGNYCMILRMTNRRFWEWKKRQLMKRKTVKGIVAELSEKSEEVLFPSHVIRKRD